MAKRKKVEPPKLMVNPLTGEEFNLDDTDELMNQIIQSNAVVKEAYTFIEKLKARILPKATFLNGKSVAYILGEKFKAKIEKKADTWDNKRLAALHKTEMGKLWIRISAYKVWKRDLDTLLATSGNTALDQFKRELLDARRPATGAPSVSVMALDAVEKLTAEEE